MGWHIEARSKNSYARKSQPRMVAPIDGLGALVLVHGISNMHSPHGRGGRVRRSLALLG
jgi:hypothetical protein